MINPVMTSLKNWIGALMIDFPSDIIPEIEDESKWRDLCNIISTSPSFAKVGVPSTVNFNDWESWAARVYELLG